MSNNDKCETCEYFQADYDGNVNPDVGLCEHKVASVQIPAADGLIMMCVHKEFGCVHHHGIPAVKDKINPADCPRCGFLDHRCLKPKTV